jgi:hypothetical protein
MVEHRPLRDFIAYAILIFGILLSYSRSISR